MKTETKELTQEEIDFICAETEIREELKTRTEEETTFEETCTDTDDIEILEVMAEESEDGK